MPYRRVCLLCFRASDDSEKEDVVSDQNRNLAGSNILVFLSRLSDGILAQYLRISAAAGGAFILTAFFLVALSDLLAGVSFKQQSYGEPGGSIIQADQPVDIEGSVAVIPGTDAEPAKEPACGIFGGEDQRHIYASAHQHISPAQQLSEGLESGSHSVDGKHEQRSVSHHSLIPVVVIVAQAGGEQFDSPADKSAFDKFIFHEE